MARLIIETSWEEKGGIGRFTREVSSRLKGTHKARKLNQASSPLSTIFFAVQSLFYKKNDVFLYFGYIPPLFSKQKYYFFLYDLNHIDVEYNSSFIKRIYYNVVIKRGCKKAEKVFTISNFSKNRIVDWSGIDESNVINVGCGVSEVFSQNISCYNAGVDYIFCPSSRKKHKNEDRLIEAFSKLNKGESLHLFLTGYPNKDILKKIENLNVKSCIHFLGDVSEDKLAALYKGAKFVVFPSLYEGFGLPILEAMASGTAVATSLTTATSEVAGAAAILFNPYVTEDIYEAMNKLIHSDKLITDLIDLGYKRSSQYSWDASVRTLESSIFI